jgi:hypothetical protein
VAFLASNRAGKWSIPTLAYSPKPEVLADGRLTAR